MSSSPANNCRSSSSRWSPTEEQVMVLHALYRRGLTKPNPSQVERITSQLSLYGRVHSKNVLYWFQNRKSRDRKNLMKKLHQQQQSQLHHHHHHHHHQLINYYYTPAAFAHQLFNCGERRLSPQEVADGGMMMMDRDEQTWTVDNDDLPKECLIETNGQDSVGCRKRRPLETLELFPLRPTTRY